MAYTVWMHGQIYHSFSPLYPDKVNKSGYAQLYIFDSAESAKDGLNTSQTKHL
jgi:hypothetical protein